MVESWASFPAMVALSVLVLVFGRIRTRWSGLWAVSIASPVVSIFAVEPAGGALRILGAAALLGVVLEMRRWPSGKMARVQQARGALEELPKSPEGGDAALAQGYATLTNRFLATARPVLGTRLLERTLSAWAASSGLGVEIRPDGALRLRPGQELPPAPQLLRAFFGLNLRIAELLRVFRSPAEVREMFAAIFGSASGSYGEMLYAHRTPLLLFRAAVDPLLEAIPDKDEARRRLAAVEPLLGIGPDGKVALAGLYDSLSKLEPAERGRRAIETLSASMRALHPLASETVGAERSAALLSRGVSQLLRDHGPFLASYRLDDILPRGVALPGLFRARPGGSYLIRDPAWARELFRELVRPGLPGLSIARTFPEGAGGLQPADPARAAEEAPPGVEVRWLGRKAPDGSPGLERMAEVLKVVDEFCGSREGAVVLLDGVEYLATRHDFANVLRFLQDLKEVVAARGARLLVPVDPAALEERQMALLSRDLETLREPSPGRA